MLQKILAYVFLTILLTQLSFSFYYSSEMISLNSSLNHNLDQINLLEKNKLKLEKTFATTVSLDQIYQYALSKGFTPINESN